MIPMGGIVLLRFEFVKILGKHYSKFFLRHKYKFLLVQLAQQYQSRNGFMINENYSILAKFDSQFYCPLFATIKNYKSIFTGPFIQRIFTDRLIKKGVILDKIVIK